MPAPAAAAASGRRSARLSGLRPWIRSSGSRPCVCSGKGALSGARVGGVGGRQAAAWQPPLAAPPRSPLETLHMPASVRHHNRHFAPQAQASPDGGKGHKCESLRAGGPHRTLDFGVAATLGSQLPLLQPPWQPREQQARGGQAGRGGGLREACSSNSGGGEQRGRAQGGGGRLGSAVYLC